MPVSLPKPLTDGTTAYGSDVRSNDDALAAKFTEGGNGISDADIASSAAISGLKISTTATRRVPTAAIEDLAVTTGKIALLAVDTAQIAALAVTKAKIAVTTITAAQINLGSQQMAFSLGGIAGKSYVALYPSLEASGANYVVSLHSLAVNATGDPSAAAVTLTPGVAIPIASNIVVGIHLNAVAIGAVGLGATGNVIIIYLPNT